eukprot:jgi/Chrzof1/15002/Cz09g23240.t1
MVGREVRCAPPPGVERATCVEWAPSVTPLDFRLLVIVITNLLQLLQFIRHLVAPGVIYVNTCNKDADAITANMIASTCRHYFVSNSSPAQSPQYMPGSATRAL